MRLMILRMGPKDGRVRALGHKARRAISRMPGPMMQADAGPMRDALRAAAPRE